MKKWVVYVGGFGWNIEASKPETAIFRGIRAERKRLRERGKEIGKRLSLIKKGERLEISIREAD